MRNRELAVLAIVLACGSGLIGFSLKFATYVNVSQVLTASGQVKGICSGHGYTTIFFTNGQNITLVGNLVDMINFGNITVIQKADGYFLPPFPNYLDAVFLGMCGLILIIIGLNEISNA